MEPTRLTPLEGMARLSALLRDDLAGEPAYSMCGTCQRPDFRCECEEPADADCEGAEAAE